VEQISMLERAIARVPTILVYGNFTNNGTANFGKAHIIAGDLFTAS
jgi:hypothetical protein